MKIFLAIELLMISLWGVSGHARDTSMTVKNVMVNNAYYLYQHRSGDGFVYYTDTASATAIPTTADGARLKSDDVLYNNQDEAITLKELVLRGKKVLKADGTDASSNQSAPAASDKPSKNLDAQAIKVLSGSGVLRFCKYTSSETLGDDGISFSQKSANCDQGKFKIRAVECIDEKVGRVTFDAACAVSTKEISADACVTQLKDEIVKNGDGSSPTEPKAPIGGVQ